jgi:hypothetical protein
VRVTTAASSYGACGARLDQQHGCLRHGCSAFVRQRRRCVRCCGGSRIGHDARLRACSIELQCLESFSRVNRGKHLLLGVPISGPCVRRRGWGIALWVDRTNMQRFLTASVHAKIIAVDGRAAWRSLRTSLRMIAASAQRHASVTCRQRAVARRSLRCLLLGYTRTCSPPVVLSARMLPLSGQHCLTAVFGMSVSLRVARVPVHLVG